MSFVLIVTRVPLPVPVSWTLLLQFWLLLLYWLTVSLIGRLPMGVPDVVPICTVRFEVPSPAIEAQPESTTVTPLMATPLASDTPVTANLREPPSVLWTPTVKVAVAPSSTGLGVWAVTVTVPTSADATPARTGISNKLATTAATLRRRRLRPRFANITLDSFSPIDGGSAIRQET